MKDKGSGWHREPRRHALAAKGIETGRKSTASPKYLPKSAQESMKLYHGTSEKKVKKIMKEGLKPGCQPLYEETGIFLDIDSGKIEHEDVIYLTTNFEDAIEFARNAAMMENDGKPCVIELNAEKIGYKHVMGGMPDEFCSIRRISPKHVIRVIEVEKTRLIK